MDLLLTSFGFGMAKHATESPFLQMPPLLMNDKTGYFLIDYCAFLMFDRVLLDQASYEHMISGDHSSYAYNDERLGQLREAHRRYGQLLTHLREAGRLVLVDFSSILQECRSIFDEAVAYDMKNLEEWVTPIEASTEAWRTQWQLALEAANLKNDESDEEELNALRILVHAVCHRRHNFYLDILKQWRKRQDSELRRHARDYVRDFIAYINANIVISRKLGVPFIDWEDMHPFYRKKFHIAGQEDQTAHETAEQTRKLFEVLFPYFVPSDLGLVAKAINDPRIQHLRDLTSLAAQGKATFDAEFAADTFRQVFDIERRVRLRRKVVAWSTRALGLIPGLGGVAQPVAEEGLNAFWSDRPRNELPWFYLINDLVSGPRA
jgi:hypothetical protein